jgi:hypothetical protein
VVDLAMAAEHGLAVEAGAALEVGEAFGDPFERDRSRPKRKASSTLRAASTSWLSWAALSVHQRVMNGLSSGPSAVSASPTPGSSRIDRPMVRYVRTDQPPASAQPQSKL